LTEDKVIIDDIPSATYHDGGQIAFGSDGMLYLTTGDAEEPDNAQNLNSLSGKTLRITDDGAIPSDNPFGTAIWSYGHRNAQGIAWDDAGRMWQTEHGRTSGVLSGYDELNQIVAGANYGWPSSQGTTVLGGTTGPAIQSGSTNTWAPSGLAYDDGSLYFAGLRGESLYVADVAEDGSIADFRQYFEGVYGRLRAVTLGPDGFLYVTTSNRDGRGTAGTGDDKIIQIAPDFLHE
jgi:glucose/arabinose dehydrogenase